MMIKIKIPDSFTLEKEYIINVFFNVFLGLEYSIQYTDKTNYVIENVTSGKKLIFYDFFKNQIASNQYLAKKNVPLKTFLFKSKFSPTALVGLFGENRLVEEENEIYCGLDILASAFFMLTRWEEYVNPKRDKHNRFPATESIAYQHGFLHRPIVNEYVDFLWKLLEYSGYKGERKVFNYQAIPTHDIDFFRYHKNSMKYFAHDLLEKRNIKVFWERMKTFTKNPYNTFDYFMDVSEEKNTQSKFYFMAGGESEYDTPFYLNEKAFKRLIARINERGHLVGFHPSYNTYNSINKFQKEKRLLEKSAGMEITEGRQHFLRFNIPKTWQIWEQSGMKLDSTMSYADVPGFRCGICYDFPIFDILQRKQLDLWERPLILMEGSLVDYQKLTPLEFKEAVNYYKKVVKQYNGNFVFLWHNSSFNGIWTDYEKLYLQLF